MPEPQEMPEEGEEKESTVTCPNCGAQLTLELEEPEEGPSIRDALKGAMGGQ